jgi:hypothetical protein
VLQKARKHRSLNRHGIDLQLEPERPQKRLTVLTCWPNSAKPKSKGPKQDCDGAKRSESP